ncbi:NUDIX hydrolase [Luteococcus sp. Sow4_B9]|uniref:NUDIX hydrolase n=1 Tax=Luteococcus sp. Sow4_B9 TaxID=3438792 RepID=UPI003F9BB180
MGSKGRITAAGAVVLRGEGDRREVLVVRRSTHKDWSLPKGKPKTDEDLPATAVREVHEETGVRIHLGLPVGQTRYDVGKQRKVVSWWMGIVEHERRRQPNKEVEKAVWMPLDKALEKLSYPNEAEILTRALELESAGTLLVVRHGKAMLRKHWTGSDARRPLSRRGRKQARQIRGLLAAYGTSELLSSTSTRCMQTLIPFALERNLPVVGISLLSEEEAEGHGSEVQQLMAATRRRIAAEGTTVAVCGHRPVLPDMRQGLEVPDKAMLVGEVLVVHLDPEGHPLTVENHKCIA